jgi:hypothetical protein
MSDDGDEWADLFARAEGIVERVTPSEPEQTENGKKKRKRSKNFNDSPSSSYLEKRLSSKIEWPSWLLLAGSFDRYCKKWKGHNLLCRNCQRSAMFHQSLCSSSQQLQYKLFDCLRNVRCATSLFIQGHLTLEIVKEFQKQLQHLKLTDLAEKVRLLHDFDGAIRILIECDKTYHELYYARLTNEIAADIPHPVSYFGMVVSYHTPDSSSKRVAESLYTKSIAEHWGDLEFSSSTSTTKHPLLLLHQYRLLESLELFSHCKTTPSAVLESLTKPLDDDHEVPAPDIMREWRDSCRDFLCHLYAYATVTTKALDRVVQCMQDYSLESIIELGAGTGYIAKLLQDRGIVVEPYDAEPTASPNACNEYHGNVPPYTNIERGNEKTILFENKGNSLSGTALLLCYPPPNSKFASRSLKHFLKRHGQVCIFIGEFQGLTGTKEFEQCLLSEFNCVDRIPSLCWGTDASTTTIWVNRQTSSAAVRDLPLLEPGNNTPYDQRLLLPCSLCGAKEAKKRCRLLRYLNYCSVSCFQQHESERAEHLSFASIDLGDFKLNFFDSNYFLELY